MPLTGSLNLATVDAGAPLMSSTGTEQLELKGAEVLQLLYEIDESGITSLLPSALHPTIPPTISFVATKVADSPFGGFTLAEARIGCRSAARPRAMLLRAYCNNEDAAKALRERWGYPVVGGHVRLQRNYDRISLVVEASGDVVLDCSLMDPEPVGNNDIQYIANLNLARIPRDGGAVTRLVQVDPEYLVLKADRGLPRLDAFDAEAWLVEGAIPDYAISASVSTGNVVLPQLRYLVDPAKGPMDSVERV